MIITLEIAIGNIIFFILGWYAHHIFLVKYGQKPKYQKFILKIRQIKKTFKEKLTLKK